jgi:hypothetical protein
MVEALGELSSMIDAHASVAVVGTETATYRWSCLKLNKFLRGD